MSFGAGGPPGLEATGDGPRQVVRSAEQVHLELPVAGPGTRILSYAIDYLVIALLQLALIVLVLLVAATSATLQGWIDGLGDRAADLASGDPALVGLQLSVFMAIFIVFQLVAEWGYFVVSEMTTGGRSLGKAVLGLRVVGDGGAALTLRASLARNLLRLVDVLPSSYLVGLVAMLVSPEGKRLGDVVAGTVVIRLDSAPLAAPIVVDPDADPAEFRFDRSQLGRIRESERALLRQTLRRLDELDPERAEQALERATLVLCDRLEHPPVPVRRRRAFLEALWQAGIPRG